jgi:ABC-type multidrug transport system fused ATPase/permease subunit
MSKLFSWPLDGCMYLIIILNLFFIKISSFEIFTSCFAATLSSIGLIQPIQSFAKALSSGGYVFEIIERQSQIDIFNDNGEIPSNFIGEIEFRNVHFTYPSRQEALVNNSFRFSLLNFYFEWFNYENSIGKNSCTLWFIWLW